MWPLSTPEYPKQLLNIAVEKWQDTALVIETLVKVA